MLSNYDDGLPTFVFCFCFVFTFVVSLFPVYFVMFISVCLLLSCWDIIFTFCFAFVVFCFVVFVDVCFVFLFCLLFFYGLRTRVNADGVQTWTSYLLYIRVISFIRVLRPTFLLF